MADFLQVKEDLFLIIAGCVAVMVWGLGSAQCGYKERKERVVMSGPSCGEGLRGAVVWVGERGCRAPNLKGSREQEGSRGLVRCAGGFGEKQL